MGVLLDWVSRHHTALSGLAGGWASYYLMRKLLGSAQTSPAERDSKGNIALRHSATSKRALGILAVACIALGALPLYCLIYPGQTAIKLVLGGCFIGMGLWMGLELRCLRVVLTAEGITMYNFWRGPRTILWGDITHFANVDSLYWFTVTGRDRTRIHISYLLKGVPELLAKLRVHGHITEHEKKILASLRGELLAYCERSNLPAPSLAERPVWWALPASVWATGDGSGDTPDWHVVIILPALSDGRGSPLYICPVRSHEAPNPAEALHQAVDKAIARSELLKDETNPSSEIQGALYIGRFFKEQRDFLLGLAKE